MANEYNNVVKENKGKKGEGLLRGLVFECDCSPKEIYVNNQLSALQYIVGGFLERIPLYHIVGDGIVLLCDEGAKMKDIVFPNCVLTNKEDGRVIATILGTFFVVGQDGSDFRSLTDDEVIAVREAYRKTIIPFSSLDNENVANLLLKL